MTAPLVYTFPLDLVAIILGLAILGCYGWCFAEPTKAATALRAFPRHYPIGIALTCVATFWFLWLLNHMDLMEYSVHRTKFLIGFSLLAASTVWFLRDFLSVRALGVILLLGAKVLLDAAFLRDIPSKFLVTIVAYGMAIKGIVLVAWPYLMRDAIEWLHAHPRRPRIGYTSGMIVGLALVLCGIFLYR